MYNRVQLRVYLNPIDSNPNIEKGSEIFVKLPVYETSGNKITWNSDNLNKLGLDEHEKEGTINSSTTMLTNKNRVQFTLPLTAESYYGTKTTVEDKNVKTPSNTSALIAYASIFYKTSETTIDEETGEKTTNTINKWILSENHAE